MAKTKLVPYDADGKVIKEIFTGWRRGAQCEVAEWKECKPFEAQLTFTGVAVSQYSDKFAFKAEDGEQWEMVRAQFERVVPLMVFGQITATFRIDKVRDCYLLALA